MILPHRLSTFVPTSVAVSGSYTNCFLNGFHKCPLLHFLFCSLPQESLSFLLSLYHFSFLSFEIIYVSIFKVVHMVHLKIAPSSLRLPDFPSWSEPPDILFLPLLYPSYCRSQERCIRLFPIWYFYISCTLLEYEMTVLNCGSSGVSHRELCTWVFSRSNSTPIRIHICTTYPPEEKVLKIAMGKKVSQVVMRQ